MKLGQNTSEEMYVEEKAKVFDPVKFFSKFVKYWPYFLLSIIIAFALAFLVNKTTPPVYQVSGKFFVKEEGANLGILDLTGMNKGAMASQNHRLSNETIFLKSRPVAEKVLAKLDFDVDYYEPGAFVPKELYKNSPIIVQVDWNHPQIVGDKISISWTDTEKFRVNFPGNGYSRHAPGGSSVEIDLDEYQTKSFNFGDWVDLPYARFKVNLTENLSSGETLIQVRTRNSLIAKYTGEDMQVWAIDNLSSIVGLSLNTSHPGKGSDYINTLMEVYLENELEEKNRIARNTVDFIDSQISGVADTLNYIERNLQDYRSANRTYNISEESNQVYQEITKLEGELQREKFKRQYYQNLQSYLVRESYEQIIMPSGIGIDDPILNSLIQNLITLQNDRSSLLATQTEASPRVREVSRRIQDTNASLQEVLRNVNTNTQFVIADLEDRISRSSGQYSRLPTTEQNLIKIQREYTLNETIYNFLLQRRAEAAISMASSSASNKIVEYAQAAAEPIKVRATAIYLIAIAAGFLIPFTIIAAITVMDKRIKDPKELEESLAVPLLGKIAKNRTESSLAVLLEPRSAIAETFRSLKTNISFVVPQDSQMTLAISSTLSGEGKTFTAINMASIYSLNNKKTILISCDMFKPNSFRDFGLKNKIGLSNFLSKQVDQVHEVIQPTKYPKFDIITAGAVPPNPSELLGSERFSEMVEDLKKIYDVIILDTPPVGLISQSYEVLKHVDMILYVLRYNFSDREFVDEINDIRVKKGIKNLYAVLNDVSDKELTYKGFNYGYYEEYTGKKSGLKGIFSRNKAAL
jgi:tyrosine-protein kinase Etk/Wzc